MNENKYGFFDPRNPMYLEFARWVVIVTSAIAILIGIIGLEESGFLGITVILGGILSYFIGMIFVNMLYNIRDIKINTEKTNILLEKQLNQNKNETLD